ncbi:ADR198Cp [Eremothecium gossypii ATCC 10895]|uniref:ADR198Cp n=1 Tax=Eremothecium gossypii (strain ATCC 10895 / CBS 109.51 / FGSC 9923 / NRRL Y-1056) TaxID=284811 RepID=Q759S5_EREGS|nr:ADR198Cp [Eremothecium gossypii ATCC 10895]AAS52118.2 ADR198Cp [Eremothecium gossypii ATCC 10895]AEY96417.1 FADR198Cp [Eremothecium gossypii FDAG1]
MLQDYHGLWSWYLGNLRKGRFEQLVGDEARYSQLKAFLRDCFAHSTGQERRLQLLSFPASVPCDYKILEEFIRQQGNISVAIPRVHATGTEKHYLVDGNYMVHALEGCNLALTENEPFYTDSMSIEERSEIVSGMSLVFDFKPRFEHSTSNPVHSMRSSSSEMHSGSVRDAAFSGLDDMSIRSNESCESFSGQELVRVLTHEGDSQEYQCDSTETRIFRESYSDISSLSQFSNHSVFPSLSITNDFSKFRVVLQSILVYDCEKDRINTAVRQYNNNPNIANCSDDWLLYDNKFSLDNLRILSFVDLMELNRAHPKMLFYSVAEIFNSSPRCSAAGCCAQVHHSQPQLLQRNSFSASTLSRHSLRLLPTVTSANTIERHVRTDVADKGKIPNSPAFCWQKSVDYTEYYQDQLFTRELGLAHNPSYSSRSSNSEQPSERLLPTDSKAVNPIQLSRHVTPVIFSSIQASADVDFEMRASVATKASSRSGLDKISTRGSFSTARQINTDTLPTLLHSISHRKYGLSKPQIGKTLKHKWQRWSSSQGHMTCLIM